MSNAPEVARFYFGHYIHPKNVYGMYSSLVFGRRLAADTLAGMREAIREERARYGR